MSLAEQLDAEMAEMSERHLRNLAELAEIGMDLSRAVKRRVAEVETAGADDNTGALGELGLTLNRVTRAVRLTMTLEARVRYVRRARLLGLETQRAEVAARKVEAEKRRVDAREVFLGCLIEDTVKLDILRRNGLEASALYDDETEFDEEEDDEIEAATIAASRLLYHRKAYAGFADRPVSAVLAQVCADLGLTPDWSLWAEDDWAIEEAESVAGSPFAELSMTEPCVGAQPDCDRRETGPP